MEEEIKYCKNCRRDVSAKNYVIHSVHCERKIQLCYRCSDPVPRSELEKHEEQFHSKVACLECGVSVEKCQIEKHKESCVKRLVPCEYCELEVPLDNLSEHCIACGSRTEQCSKCSKFVMIKDLDIHNSNCSRKNFSDSISCHYYGDTFNTGSILGQPPIEVCRSQGEKCNECHHYIQKEDMELHLTMCEQKKHLMLEIPCHFCGDLFPTDILEDHADICGTRLQKCEKCNKYISLKNFETHSNICKESLSKTHGNCPVCKQLVPWSEMNVHSAHCAEIYYETNEYECQNKFNELSLKQETEKFVDKSVEEKTAQWHPEKDVEICPSCKYRIPEQKYDEHLLLCFNDKTQCPFCGIEVPRNYEHLHLQDCHKIV